MLHIQHILPDLFYYCLAWMHILNMPGGSSTAREEPDRAGTPLPLPGAMGSALGGTGLDNLVVDPPKGSPANTQATTSIAEGVHWQEKYSLLVHIFTTRDRWALEPHAWVKDLLKDFFQSTLGINLSVILLSPTECLIFCGNHTQGQGMKSHCIMPTSWWAHTLGRAAQ